MTADEYRRALRAFDDAQFDAFRRSWGGTADSVEASVEKYAYADEPEKWDRIAVYRLRQLGVTDVYTEAEKMYAMVRLNAESAKASAEASAQSATTATWALRASWLAVVAAVLTSFVTLTLARGC